MEGTGAEPPAEAAEDDAAGGEATVLPSLRSLVIAFLVGAIAVAGWSWDNPLFELDGEEQTVLHRCTQQVADRVGHAVTLEDVDVDRDGDGWIVSGDAAGGRRTCRIRAGEVRP